MMSTLLNSNIATYYETYNEYLHELRNSPLKKVASIIDIILVMVLIVKFVQMLKGTRALQLLKGILFLILITIISSLLELKILNFILTSFMTYGVLFLLIVFQPELRRALEQLRN